jgi:hypothetical protein
MLELWFRCQQLQLWLQLLMLLLVVLLLLLLVQQACQLCMLTLTVTGCANG